MKVENAESMEIKLVQAPVIACDTLAQIGTAVKERMNELGLDSLVVDENSLKSTKALRAELNKEFAEFENRRKLIKDLVLKPYNDFDEKYREHISLSYNNADKLLKEKISGVEAELLKQKVDGLRSYFNSVKTHDFLTYEDMDLKVTQSTSDATYFKQIDVKMQAVSDDLTTINTMPDKDRILVKYRISKNLNQAITQVNIEKAQEERLAEAAAKIAETTKVAEASKVIEPKIEQEQTEVPTEDAKVYRATFTVKGTKAQLQSLKVFMQQEGITYE